MEVKGKVIEKLPLKEGMGSRGPWSIAQLVIEYMDGQYPTTVCIQNSKEARAFDAIPVGATGTFTYSATSRKSQDGRWFTSCNCYKWQLDTPAAPPQEADNSDLPC